MGLPRPIHLMAIVGVALLAAGCSASSGIETASVTPVAQAKPQPTPDCSTLRAEIDQLRAAGVPAKIQKAAAKTYTPSAEEYAVFPRYSALVDTYTVKQCTPELPTVQAVAAPTARKTAVKSVKSSKAAKAKSRNASAAKPTRVAAPAVAKPARPAPKVAPAAPASDTPQIVWPSSNSQVKGVTLQVPANSAKSE